jgi:hypothetical protein
VSAILVANRLKSKSFVTSSGELPAIKIGGRGIWRVDRRQLDDYLDALMKKTQKWAKDHPLNA